MRKIFICDNIYDSEKRNFYSGFIVVEDGIISNIKKKPFLKDKELIGEVYDFGENYLIPGFVDAHTHLLQTEVRDNRIDLSKEKTKVDIIEKLMNVKEEMIFAENFDESNTEEKEFFSKAEMDSISKEKPVIIRRICGHIAFVNSVALRILAKYDSSIGDEHILREEQVFGLDSIFKEDESVLESHLRNAIKKAHSVGITAIGEFATPDHFKIYQKLAVSDDLPLRVSLFLRYKHFESLKKAQLYGGFGNEFLKLNGIKFFMDGSIGGYTAAMSFYYKEKQTRGIVLIDNLGDLIKIPVENNFQIAVHAIGDRAVEEVIKVYERFSGVATNLLRIEHAEILTDELIERIADSDLHLVMQPNFVRNWDYGENHMYNDRLGKYAKFNNRYRDIAAKGIKMAFSSDSMPMSPLYGIKNIDAFERENQILSFNDALYYYTKGSAEAIRRNDIGEIKQGKKADFAILDGTLNRVKMTILCGEVVFDEENRER